MQEFWRQTSEYMWQRPWRGSFAAGAGSSGQMLLRASLYVQKDFVTTDSRRFYGTKCYASGNMAWFLALAPITERIVGCMEPFHGYLPGALPYLLQKHLFWVIQHSIPGQQILLALPMPKIPKNRNSFHPKQASKTFMLCNSYTKYWQTQDKLPFQAIARNILLFPIDYR